MLPHALAIALLLLVFYKPVLAQQRKAPAGGLVAVVVDERLAAVRSTPRLTGKLVRRLSRGRLVAVRASKSDTDGVVFFLVNVTSRTRGWIQREAVVSVSRAGDDRRLLRLIEASQGFDRISRARLFLDHFPRSVSRSSVLLLLGNTAEELAGKLSRDAARRLNGATGDVDGTRGDAPEFSYFLNYTGLDRYNRQGVGFIFDSSTKQFHYNGAAWREILRRHPNSPAAPEARKRLLELSRYSQ
jgi:hypothetical protein